MVLRFSDILRHRLTALHAAFAKAIAENDYRGDYAAVYPIKVNQQRPVVEEIYRHGAAFGFGLEVGSKPELLAVMALTGGDRSGRPIVCNGFKDSDYLEAVILATKLGRNIFPVIENMNELHLVIAHAERYGVRPQLGVRVKLATRGTGRWRDSAGERSKFGLTASELLDMLARLDAHGMKDCLRLVHCHAGSQLHDIARVKDVIGELAHVYGELVALGAGLEYLDVGGGLGVDYDGSQSSTLASVNYTLEEYASEVVYRIASVCDARGVEHPRILSESGRAIAAYQSVLVFDVLGSIGLDRPELSAGQLPEPGAKLPQPILDLAEAYRSVEPGRLVECYHDALTARQQASNLFALGYVSLEERSLAERLFSAICVAVRDACRRLDEPPDELQELERLLADTYVCNLSIFQSLPDAWAIEQRFPIVPIHRLDEQPGRLATLADLTCDSDGRIDRFIDARDGMKAALEVHELEPGAPYYMAAFLVGAYQETLGDLHNLFGDAHVVHIRLHEDGGWWIDEVVDGDTAREVLGYVQYDVERLYPRVREDCESAVRAGRLSLAESRTLRRFYQNELDGYTYLERDNSDE